MSNERKNHDFPAPLNYPTPDQLKNSREKLSSTDPRYERYGRMISEAESRLREHLESEHRRGILPKRERKILEGIKETSS